MSEEDIEEMFNFADKDCDGKISYIEFQTMINPPKPPQEPKPRLPTAKRVTIKTTEPEKVALKITEPEQIKTVTIKTTEQEPVQTVKSTEPDLGKTVTVKAVEAEKESVNNIDNTNTDKHVEDQEKSAT